MKMLQRVMDKTAVAAFQNEPEALLYENLPPSVVLCGERRLSLPYLRFLRKRDKNEIEREEDLPVLGWMDTHEDTVKRVSIAEVSNPVEQHPKDGAVLVIQVIGRVGHEIWVCVGGWWVWV